MYDVFPTIKLIYGCKQFIFKSRFWIWVRQMYDALILINGRLISCKYIYFIGSLMLNEKLYDKLENFWPWAGLYEGHKAKKGQKNKYGSKCLELFNSARNAKKLQKEPKT